MVMQVLAVKQKPTMLSNHAEVRLLSGTRCNSWTGGQIRLRKMLPQEDQGGKADRQQRKGLRESHLCLPSPALLTEDIKCVDDHFCILS